MSFISSGSTTGPLAFGTSTIISVRCNASVSVFDSFDSMCDSIDSDIDSSLGDPGLSVVGDLALGDWGD